MRFRGTAHAPRRSLRGFLCEAARIAIVTDAEIFGRYKVQRPVGSSRPRRRVHSALDIDFTDLVEGDYVVHLQYGIGRYLGLQRLPPGRVAEARLRTHPSPGLSQPARNASRSSMRQATEASRAQALCAVTESHLVSKYVGAGRIRRRSTPSVHALGQGQSSGQRHRP